MSMRKLASKIAKTEGKKSQVKIGDVREIVGIISDLIYKDCRGHVFQELYKNGHRRAMAERKKGK